MLNRRQIRIKIYQLLFAYYSEEHPDMALYEKAMHRSFNSFRELYLLFFVVISEMQALAIERIEAGKNKRLPTKEDLHPNTKFVANALLRMLVNSKNLEREVKEYGTNFNDNPEVPKQVFKALLETAEYKEYLDSKERGFDHDKEHLIRFFKRHIVNAESLQDYFEERNVFWADDVDLAASMVIKTLKTAKESEDDIALLPLWKEDDDDKNFTLQLWRQTLALGAESEKQIAAAATNWETDRIALTDLILMKMALAEVQTFDQVPVKVTMNEYIELSKYYSTPKSSTFINGVLDQLFGSMKETGAISKVGRGLVE